MNINYCISPIIVVISLIDYGLIVRYWKFWI
jgi:hypothetical protein